MNEASSPETDRGRALFEELLWVHSIIRSDLEFVEQLAADVGDGLPGEAVEDALGELKTNGPLWRLKVSCLRYCSHVHAHHGAEDVLLFPALRAADAAIAPVVDRLEADHVRVSDRPHDASPRSPRSALRDQPDRRRCGATSAASAST
jgi:Hemerythrin HHE cation binding domain